MVMFAAFGVDVRTTRSVFSEFLFLNSVFHQSKAGVGGAVHISSGSSTDTPLSVVFEKCEFTNNVVEGGAEGGTTQSEGGGL